MDDKLIRPGENLLETEFDRRTRLQDDTLRDITRFNAGDRLPREEAHRRGGVR